MYVVSVLQYLYHALLQERIQTLMFYVYLLLIPNISNSLLYAQAKDKTRR